jgi:ATP-dependent helicase/nuclease subunit A
MDEVMRLIEHPDMAALFGADARAEAPIAGVLTLDDGSLLALSGQIDRYVETQDAVLLVDFKTGYRPKALAMRTLLQMASYGALMHGAKPGKPVRCGLIWTRSGDIEWLKEADLNAALAEIMSGQRKPG